MLLYTGNDENFVDNLLCADGSDCSCGDDVINSGDGDDFNVGDNGNCLEPQLDCSGGDDKIKSGKGDDTNCGDNADSDNNCLTGVDDGNDKINAGQGDDELTGGSGADKFKCGLSKFQKSIPINSHLVF